MNNIVLQDVGADRDAITSLRAPTHFGRPNWDRVFGGVRGLFLGCKNSIDKLEQIVDRHPDTDVGVFFCGPAPLSKTCVSFVFNIPSY